MEGEEPLFVEGAVQVAAAGSLFVEEPPAEGVAGKRNSKTLVFRARSCKEVYDGSHRTRSIGFLVFACRSKHVDEYFDPVRAAFMRCFCWGAPVLIIRSRPLSLVLLHEAIKSAQLVNHFMACILS